MSKIIIGFAILLCATGCSKEQPEIQNTSINVINAAVNMPSIKVNYFGTKIKWSSYTDASGSVNYAANKTYSIFNAVSPHILEIVSNADTLGNLFKGNIGAEVGKVLSVYVIGNTGTYDGLVKKETVFPYNFADSAIAVRFINLSPNSPAVNITLASTPTVVETADLAYKQQTEFKKYTNLKVVPTGSLTFQVRDALSNAILTTYIIPVNAASPYTIISTTLSRFRSITLAIKGLAGTTTGANAYSVFPIAHY